MRMPKFEHFFRCAIVFVTAAAMIFPLLSACSKKVEPPKRGEVLIRSMPDGASVILGDRPQKTKTPLKGKLPPGNYIIRIFKPGYRMFFGSLKIQPGERTEIQAVLQPETADVLLKSVPSGAEVIFNRVVCGSTPLVLRNLPAGSYSATLRLPGFSEKIVQWNVNGPRPKTVSDELSSNIGTLRISSSPSGSAVLINGKHVGVTPFTERKSQGHYKIRVTRNGYFPYETDVAVNKNKTSQITAVLSLMPGSINIRCSTPGAIVSVNGEDYGSNPKTLENLTPGVYSIEVRKAGFDTAHRTVSLAAGQKIELDFSLDSNTGGIDIITYPPGVTLYLNGRLVGATERDLNQPDCSKVFQIRNLAVGEYTLTIAHKRATPNKITRKISVQKGKITRLNNISMWVANAVVTLKNGRVSRGRLVSEQGRNKIVFQPEYGITFTYSRDEVVSIEKIREEE